MKTFWRYMAKLGIIGLAVVGILSLLGLAPIWAGLAGLLVWDIAVLVRINQPAPKARWRRIDPLGPRHMFLN